jgi:hypothetical protein
MPSSEPNELVRLNAEPPLRVLQTVVDRELRITRDIRPVHRLQEKMLEREGREFFGRSIFLWVNQLELTAARLHEWGASLGTDADPIQGLRCGTRPIGLYRDVEPALVQSGDEGFVQLQEGLTACADYVLPTYRGRLAWFVPAVTEVTELAAPAPIDCIRKRHRAREFAAVWSCTDEIGVAELTHCAGPILFASRPKIAPGKSAEHRSSATLGAFALQGVEDFLHGVRHRDA